MTASRDLNPLHAEIVGVKRGFMRARRVMHGS